MIVKIPVNSDISAVVRYMFIGKTFNHYAADIYFRGEHIGMIHVLDRVVADEGWEIRAHSPTNIADEYFHNTVFSIVHFFRDKYILCHKN